MKKIDNFALSLAKAIGLENINIDLKKLILAYPNWVIKEFLEKLSRDLAML